MMVTLRLMLSCRRQKSHRGVVDYATPSSAIYNLYSVVSILELYRSSGGIVLPIVHASPRIDIPKRTCLLTMGIPFLIDIFTFVSF